MVEYPRASFTCVCLVLCCGRSSAASAHGHFPIRISDRAIQDGIVGRGVSTRGAKRDPEPSPLSLKDKPTGHWTAAPAKAFFHHHSGNASSQPTPNIHVYHKHAKTSPTFSGSFVIEVPNFLSPFGRHRALWCMVGKALYLGTGFPFHRLSLTLRQPCLS